MQAKASQGLMTGLSTQCRSMGNLVRRLSSMGRLPLASSCQVTTLCSTLWQRRTSIAAHHGLPGLPKWDEGAGAGASCVSVQPLTSNSM